MRKKYLSEWIYRTRQKQELRKKERYTIKVIKFLGDYSRLAIVNIAFIDNINSREKKGKYRVDFFFQKRRMMKSLKKVVKSHSVHNNISTSTFAELKSWRLENFSNFEEFGNWSNRMMDELNSSL